MLILIDGYNVIAPAAPPARRAGRSRQHISGAAAASAETWLHTERMRLLQRLAEYLDPELASKTHVIFDSASGNRHGPDRLRIQGIHVRFAVSHDEADDLIEELIAAHHSPKRLTVVSSDHRLQVAASRAGAKAFDAQPWLDALLDGRVLLAIHWPPRTGKGSSETRPSHRAKPDRVSPGEVEQWLRTFQLAAQEAAETERSLQAEPAVGDAPPKQPRPSAPSLPRTGQGRGRGRAEKRSAQPTSPRSPSSRPPADKQRQRRSPSAQRPQPELPSDYNPFPEGYGEDLLGDSAE